MTVKAVCFDVGYVLVDETRAWAAWADGLGVPRADFLAALGAVIALGEHHSRVFEVVRPGLTRAQAIRDREAAGLPLPGFAPEDFYADAVPCLRELKARGFLVGISGNQPAQAETVLREMSLPVDFIASSATWGVEKPDPRFFARVLETVALDAPEVAYVGDRLDNDVLPAKAAGMVAVFLRRGPWGMLHAARPEVVRADLRLETLAGLPGALEGLR